MAYLLLDSTPTVQVFSASLVSEALLCTIQSYPSGSILLRTVPKADFDADRGAGLLNSLSDAVEGLLGEGIATEANGTQLTDNSVLLADAVDFTVTYVPPYPTPGQITGVVTISVQVITLDLSLLGGAGIESAPNLILDEYNKLKALAGG